MKFALLIIASVLASVYGQPTYQPINLASHTYRSGISGIVGLGGLGYSNGFGYSGLGYGRTYALTPVAVSAAPAVSYVAAPAVSYVAAAPAVQTIAAAPAVQTIAAAPAVQAVAAAPSIQAVAAAPAVQHQQVTGPISAAIESRRTVEVVDVPTTSEGPQPQTVVIGPNVQPINLEFQTQASPLAATQNHLPTPPAEPQQSSYEEQPDLLRQEIVKPVVQDVHETIVPFRRITQELKPVQETLHQILPRGEQRAFYQQQQVRQPAVATQTVQYVAQAAPAVAVAPAVRAVAVTPAVRAVATPAVAVAPAVRAVAAPAVQTVAVQAAPAVAIPAQAGLAIGYGSDLYDSSSSSTYSVRPVESIGYSSYNSYPITKKK